MHRPALFVLLSSLPAFADLTVTTEQLTFGSGFAFEKIPGPAVNDFAPQATWSVLSGRADRNGAPLNSLHDGKVPSGDDDPRANFFFTGCKKSDEPKKIIGLSDHLMKSGFFN